MSVIYLGQFPPPYGGVTVKNALLYDELSERIRIEKLGFRDVGIRSIVKRILISPDDWFVIGFGNAKLQRAFLYWLNFIHPKLLSRCVLIVMGGIFSPRLINDRIYKKACSRLKKIYVETESMANSARKLGFSNIDIYPNCRKRPDRQILVRKTTGTLSAVFFSLVSPDKGADLVLDAAETLPNVDFYVYGRIEHEYDEFLSRVESLANVEYMGVFDSVHGDVVAELRKYDLHIFPSRWPNEGVPGVLVETKIAAVPSIVSDICYNSELVRDGEEGVVLKENTASALAEAIASLDVDRRRLDDMKAAALESAERFYIDNYIDRLVVDITDKRGRVVS